MTITVLLVDDEPLARAGLRAILDAQPDIVVVGEAGDGAAVVPLLRRLQPTVIAMDVRMPLMDGIDATRLVLRTVPSPPKILIVTTFENDEYVYRALRAGANGFLLKRARPAEIANAVRTVPKGIRSSIPLLSGHSRRATATRPRANNSIVRRSPNGSRPFCG